MKTVTFGEMMLRLSAPGYSRLVQAGSLDMNFGGGEANVAVSLANYGMESCFISKFPDNELGQAAVNHLRRFGVSDRFIVRGGERIGIYFLESGASQRPSKVIYDRTGASITTLVESDLDLDAIFEGASWFHWTGITPALGTVPRQTLLSLCRAARGRGVTISCDLNYRAKLWTPAAAQSVMVPMMEFVDVCIANEEDAGNCLGLPTGASDVDAGILDEEAYAGLLSALKSSFGFAAVAVTMRESMSASRNGWSAMMLDESDCKAPYRSTRYDIQVVDRVGGGDAFAGALIARLLKKGNSREALEFAVAASCLKQTLPGDVNLVTEQEIEKLVAGSGSGRVER